MYRGMLYAAVLESIGIGICLILIQLLGVLCLSQS